MIHDNNINIIKYKHHLYSLIRKKTNIKKKNKKFKYIPLSRLSRIDDGESIPKVKILRKKRSLLLINNIIINEKEKIIGISLKFK